MLRATSSSTGGRQAVAGRPVGSGLASLAGSTLGVLYTPPRASRRALGRHERRAGALPRCTAKGGTLPRCTAKGGTLRPCCAASRASVPRGRRRLA